MKISGNYRFYRGFIEGGEAPCQKMGIYKAKPYYQGGWGK
jgi:hypothetical protein